MARKSTKENKTVYQLKREAMGLTRAQAEDKMAENNMTTLSEDRIEKLENGRTSITPYDVTKMAKAYNSPELCNYYCKNDCSIGKNYDLVLEINELPQIVLELVAKLNSVNPLVNRLIDITYNGKVTDDEVPDFARIKVLLDQITLATDSLDLWIEKSIDESSINAELFDDEVAKVREEYTD